MEFNETSHMLESAKPEFGREAPRADIRVSVGSGAYEDKLKRTWGALPCSSSMPGESPVNDRASWKGIGEIDLERARFLLSTDELREEMLCRT